MRRWVNTFRDDAGGWQMVKWWASSWEKKMLRGARLTTFHSKSKCTDALSDQARRVTTHWEYLLPPPVLSSVILISHSLACSDVRTPRSLGAHIPRCRVTSASESESLVPPRHYLESYHYQQPGSARTKLLTQTFAHPVSISTRTLTW